MQEGRAIALWTVLLGGGFIGGIWLWNDPPRFGAIQQTAPVSMPAPALPGPVPVQPVPAPQPPPLGAPPARAALPEQPVGTVPVVEPPAARATVEPPAAVAPRAPAPVSAPARAPVEPRVPPATASVAPPPDFPTIPAGPRSGDNAEARRYTDALNALSTEGYSGVDRIVPDGDQFRATAIMEGQRFEVLVNPDTGQVYRLSRPR